MSPAPDTPAEIEEESPKATSINAMVVNNHPFSWSVTQAGRKSVFGKMEERSLTLEPGRDCVTELNCDWRKVKILGDVHLDIDAYWTDDVALKRLNSIFEEAIEEARLSNNKWVIIINGDFLEWFFNRDDGPQRLIDSLYTRGRAGKYRNQTYPAYLFRSLIKKMRDPAIDVVLLEGNHDPRKWYEQEVTYPPGENGKHVQLQDVFQCSIATHLDVVQGGKHTFVSHGNMLSQESDEAWLSEWEIVKPLVKKDPVWEIVNNFWTKVDWILGKIPVLNRLYNQPINAGYKKAIKSWIEAVERSTRNQMKNVCLAHSHLLEEFDVEMEEGRKVTVHIGWVGRTDIGWNLDYHRLENWEMRQETMKKKK